MSILYPTEKHNGTQPFTIKFLSLVLEHQRTTNNKSPFPLSMRAYKILEEIQSKHINPRYNHSLAEHYMF